MRTRSSAGEAVRKTKEVNRAEPDWKEMFIDLWTSMQGVRDCVGTWEEDKDWCNAHPNKAYPSSKSEGMGRKFQMFQFLSRLRHEDIELMVSAIRKVELAKIAHRNQADTRGYVT